MSIWSKLFGVFGQRRTEVDVGAIQIFDFDYDKVDLDKIGDVHAILSPPNTTEDPVAWDEHWRGLVDCGLGGLSEMFVHDSALVNFMRKNGIHKVLCAGNGISQEPKALGAAGLEVTALDLSPFAVRICEETDFDDDYRRRLLDDELMRPGGSVSYVVGDIMDPTVCPGPYDMIIERRTAQIFEGSSMDEALAALSKRLSGTNAFFTHCHHGAWRPGDKREPRTERWFRDQGWAIWDGRDMVNSGSRRLAWIFLTTG
jgi:hypothetical protein